MYIALATSLLLALAVAAAHRNWRTTRSN